MAFYVTYIIVVTSVLIIIVTSDKALMFNYNTSIYCKNYLTYCTNAENYTSLKYSFQKSLKKINLHIITIEMMYSIESFIFSRSHWTFFDVLPPFNTQANIIKDILCSAIWQNYSNDDTTIYSKYFMKHKLIDCLPRKWINYTV